MRIVHIVNSLDYGGQEKMIISLSKILRSRGHDCNVMTIANSGKLATRTEADGILVEALNLETGFSLIALTRLVRLLSAHHADLIHLHNHRPLCFGALSKYALRVPVVFTRHGGGRLKAPRWIWSKVDRLVAISEKVARDMQDQNTCLRCRKIKVIANGIDLSRFEASSRSLPRTRVGIVARLAPEKDIATLIEAFRIVQKSLPDAELVIVGDGPERTKLESHAAGARVKFLGMRDDVPELMRDLDLFALSSLTEGISLTLLEAMAACKPVVATNVGGNPEVVIDGITGFLVPARNPQAMAEKILMLLRNPELAQQMGAAGRMKVEQSFSLKRMADDYEKIYRELVQL